MKKRLILLLVLALLISPIIVRADDEISGGDSGNPSGPTPPITNPEPDIDDGGDDGGSTTTPDQNTEDNSDLDTDTEKEEETTPNEADDSNSKNESEQTTNPRPNRVIPDTAKDIDEETKNVEKYSVTVNIIDNNKKAIKGVKYRIENRIGKILYEFESDSKTKIIEDLKPGTYYLIIESVPKGYKAKKEKYELKIDNKNIDVKLDIKSNLKTSTNKEFVSHFSIGTTLLLAFSMFDIAVGIGIIVYVKKNKVQN